MAELTVTDVVGPEEITMRDGTKMLKYEVILEDGTVASAWRPPDKDFPPKVGDKGTVDAGKFKKTPKPGAFGGGGGGGGWSGRKSPEDQAQIVRQHSQEMALRYCAVTQKTDITLEELTELIEWFDADAKQQASAPATQQLTLDEAKKELAEMAKADNIPLPMVARAIEAVTGTSVLQESDVSRLGEIKHKAQEFNTIASTEEVEIPF